MFMHLIMDMRPFTETKQKNKRGSASSSGKAWFPWSDVQLVNAVIVFVLSTTSTALFSKLVAKPCRGVFSFSCSSSLRCVFLSTGSMLAVWTHRPPLAEKKENGGWGVFYTAGWGCCGYSVLVDVVLLLQQQHNNNKKTNIHLVFREELGGSSGGFLALRSVAPPPPGSV